MNVITTGKCIREQFRRSLIFLASVSATSSSVVSLSETLRPGQALGSSTCHEMTSIAGVVFLRLGGFCTEPCATMNADRLCVFFIHNSLPTPRPSWSLFSSLVSHTSIATGTLRLRTDGIQIQIGATALAYSVSDSLPNCSLYNLHRSLRPPCYPIGGRLLWPNVVFFLSLDVCH